MRLVGFSEGARGEYVGIVSVPTILASTAATGHEVALVLAGSIPPGKEKYVVADSEEAMGRREGNGTFGVICVKPWSRWLVNVSILWRFSRIVRNADFVSLHSLYTFPVFAGYLLARLHRRPFGIRPHGVLSPIQRGISVRKKKIYNWLIADRIVRDAAVIFYSSVEERAGTADLKLPQLSVIVPDGFSADEFKDLPERGRFRQRFLGGSTGPLVLFLARLHAVKGLDLLIDAMRLVIEQRPDVRLAIVGPPDPPSFGRKVQAWIKSAGIAEQTVVTGNADAQMRLEAFADADVYTLPSQAENFGFSVFEAMACGLPVVVSETISYSGEIADCGAGIALPRKPEAFASAINSLISDPARRSAMGACGRTLADRYSLHETGIKVSNTIESIVHRTQPPPDVFPLYGTKAITIQSD